MAILAAFYFSLTPEIAKQFFSSFASIKRLLIQVGLNGVVIVTITTYISSSIIGYFRAQIASSNIVQLALFIVFDIFLKSIAFLLVTAITYLFFANVGTSFGGSSEKALAAIPETINLALQFKNLTSVYTYALLLTGFPLFLILLMKLTVRHSALSALWARVDKVLDIDKKPLKFLGILLGCFVSCGWLIASALVSSL